jgi:hypothetical protein
MEDTPEDTNTGSLTDHVERDASSCFAAAAYVPRINMIGRVFLQNKPPRPPRTKAQWEGTNGQPSPSEEPVTFPPAAHIPVPIDIKHAFRGKYIAAWRKAIHFELASLHNKGTFLMDYLPPIRNAIGNKWVFKVKAKPYGSVDRFTARLVAQWFSQRASVGYSETFFPVVKLSTVRTVLAIAAKRACTCTRHTLKPRFSTQTSKRVSICANPKGHKMERLESCESSRASMG